MYFKTIWEYYEQLYTYNTENSNKKKKILEKYKLSKHKKTLTSKYLNIYLKSKPQWGTTSHQSEWLRSKNLQAINAGEGVEKREPSYTVGGNAN